MTRVSALFIACLGLAVPNASPRSHSGPTMDDWTFIATVGGVDGITHTHLEQLLNGHHIESLIEGSIVYGVSVPTDKKAEAIKLIKDDLRERRYDITLYEDGKKTTYTIPDDDWRTTEAKVLYSEFIGRPECAPSTDLGVLLRTADVTNEILAFPYIMRIKSLERSYLAAENTVQTGHVFKIELSVNPDKEIGGKSLYYQVWDHGKAIGPNGSNEWWHGSPSEVERNQQRYDKRKTEKQPN